MSLATIEAWVLVFIVTAALVVIRRPEQPDTWDITVPTGIMAIMLVIVSAMILWDIPVLLGQTIGALVNYFSAPFLDPSR